MRTKICLMFQKEYPFLVNIKKGCKIPSNIRNKKTKIKIFALKNTITN